MSGDGGPAPHTAPPPAQTSVPIADDLLLGEAVRHLASIDQSMRRIAQAAERIANAHVTTAPGRGW